MPIAEDQREHAFEKLDDLLEDLRFEGYIDGARYLGTSHHARPAPYQCKDFAHIRMDRLYTEVPLFDNKEVLEALERRHFKYHEPVRGRDRRVISQVCHLRSVCRLH